jgi:hypothetical protein
VINFSAGVKKGEKHMANI